MNASRPLTIGVLAKAANVNVETIRYYQRIGLIKEPVKPDSGYRHYPETDITRLRFIKRSQQLGFTLHEISALLALGNRSCHDARVIAERRHRSITEKIRDLKAIQSKLEQLIDACAHNQSGLDGCAIRKGLTD